MTFTKRMADNRSSQKLRCRTETPKRSRKRQRQLGFLSMVDFNWCTFYLPTVSFSLVKSDATWTFIRRRWHLIDGLAVAQHYQMSHTANTHTVSWALVVQT